MQGAKLWFAYLQETDLRGNQMQGADLRGTYLQETDLRGNQMQGADLRGTYLQGAKLRGAQMQGAKMQGANLDGADLRLTDLSGVNFYKTNNLEGTKWDLAFYDATNPPKNLPDNITDKLLALDEPAYKTAKELQDAYREALVSDNETAITAAENALTEHLGKYREENAKNALKKTLQKTVPVLGAEETLTTVLMAIASAESAVTITGESATTAASLSGQQGVSLDGDYNLPAQAKASIEVSNPPSPDNPYNYYRSR
jgi:hypothetical protein